MLVALAIAIAPSAALAGKKEDAKAHIAKATRAHKDGQYETARAELEAAYALDPQPDLLYALGQVHAKLGNCGEAITYYKRFAATQTSPQVAQVVDQAIAACKPTSEPAPATPEPASDAPVGERPADEPAPASESSGTSASAPENAPAPVAPARRAPRSPAVTQPSPFSNQSRVPAQRSPWYTDKIGDALVAAGAVAIVIGAIEYRGALSDLDAAEDPATTTNLDRYHELVDSARGKRATSLVLTGVGGGLIAAGIVRFTLRGGKTETRSVGVAPARGGGVVTLQGRF
ncbi:MAG TPA: hypothetical protein VFK02_36305 [Kofleriaceae bacterium]|nr:hypothetical protein [Kofleriaceae bacterium]